MGKRRIERLDDAPLKADLARIDAISSKAQFTRYMADTQSGFGATLFVAGSTSDPVHRQLEIGEVRTGGMALPTRDYYFNDEFKKQRDAYRSYAQRTFEMIGDANPSAEADSVLAFETEIAKLSWSQSDLRDVDKVINLMSPAELKQYAPEFDWETYLTESKTVSPEMNIVDKTAVKAMAALYARTPLETLKTWERFKVANSASNYLSKRFVDNKFDFIRTFGGANVLKPRWRRGIEEVDARLGDKLGQVYLDRYFPPRSKRLIETLVANLKRAAAYTIQTNGWMAVSTKKAALEKLSKMNVMVGGPEKARDYSKLKIDAGDLYGNIKRIRAFDRLDDVSTINKPVDRKKWAASAATVDAYSSAPKNQIVFPAGILQPPFFDPNADAAVNYGAIGSIIGHEITHGFDDQGRKFDANGVLRDWWTKADAAKFEALTQALAAQYSAYEVLPGVFVNGTVTTGENIADLWGLKVAYTAYKLSLKGRTPRVLDNLTGDQRFFLAFAQNWRGKQSKDLIRTIAASDIHTPPHFRIIGPLRNIDEWYSAFWIGPDSKYYLPSENRIHL